MTSSKFKESGLQSIGPAFTRAELYRINRNALSNPRDILDQLTQVKELLAALDSRHVPFLRHEARKLALQVAVLHNKVKKVIEHLGKAKKESLP